MNLKDKIADYPNFPKKGILFRDFSPILGDPSALSFMVEEFSKKFHPNDVDVFAGIESRGFIFASPLSYNLSKSHVLLRKKDKLPAERYSVDFELEYGKATIEMHKDSVEKDDSVLVIDDLIATGGTAEAAAKLIGMAGAKVSGFIFVINLFDLGGADKLIKNGYKIVNLIEFPGH